MARTRHPFEDPEVEAIFAAFPAQERAGLLTLRELIFDTADQTHGVGPLLEALRWNQPAYLTPRTKSGSTLRLGLPKQGGFAIYVHCQTTIIADFRADFPDGFVYEGARAIHFQPGQTLPLAQLEVLVRRALTYHLKG